MNENFINVIQKEIEGREELLTQVKTQEKMIKSEIKTLRNTISKLKVPTSDYSEGDVDNV